MSRNEVGLTMDGSYQLGIRRVLPMDGEALWRKLVSARSMEIFTGIAEAAAGDGIGRRKTAPDGLETELAVFSEGSHLRMRWRRPGWPRDSTLQLRVLPAASGATLSVHQEGLPEAATRAELLALWEKVFSSEPFGEG